MNTKNNKPQGLLYLEEHIACKNYLIGDRALFEIIKLETGKLFIRESVGRSTLVFLLSGKIRISTRNVVNREVEAGKMFLVATRDSFYGRAVTDVTLLRCSFTQEIALCNKFALKKLQGYVSCGEPEENPDIALLAIHPLLQQELELTSSIMEKGLLCSHYQRLKQDIIFMELRGLYKREELARMFAPLIGADDDFKSRILEIYPRVSTIKELMGELQMSHATFNRKFHNSFNISPKQWLIQKKKEKLFRDIVMTNLPIAEIAEKYGFTVNYVTSFCKEHFGITPTKLRQEHSPQ